MPISTSALSAAAESPSHDRERPATLTTQAMQGLPDYQSQRAHGVSLQKLEDEGRAAKPPLADALSGGGGSAVNTPKTSKGDVVNQRGDEQGINLSYLSLSLVVLSCIFCCVCVGSIVVHNQRGKRMRELKEQSYKGENRVHGAELVEGKENAAAGDAAAGDALSTIAASPPLDEGKPLPLLTPHTTRLRKYPEGDTIPVRNTNRALLDERGEQVNQGGAARGASVISIVPKPLAIHASEQVALPLCPSLAQVLTAAAATDA